MGITLQDGQLEKALEVLGKIAWKNSESNSFPCELCGKFSEFTISGKTASYSVCVRHRYEFGMRGYLDGIAKYTSWLDQNSYVCGLCTTAGEPSSGLRFLTRDKAICLHSDCFLFILGIFPLDSLLVYLAVQ